MNEHEHVSERGLLQACQLDAPLFPEGDVGNPPLVFFLLLIQYKKKCRFTGLKVFEHRMIDLDLTQGQLS